jgi:general secretion pathway protein G
MLDHFNTLIKARIHEDNDEQGFTLIELLIVIVVLGILAAVTVFGLSGTASQSAQAACKADARTVEVAMDAFHANDTSALWPVALSDLTHPGDTTFNPSAVLGQPAGVSPYLRSAPVSTHYAITLGVTAGAGNGTVLVNGLNFDSPPPADPLNICQTVK